VTHAEELVGLPETCTKIEQRSTRCKFLVHVFSACVDHPH